VASAAQGMTVESYALKYRDEYFRRMTFVKPTMMAIQATAKMYGGLPSIGGRFHHLPPDGRDFAILNHLIQGSAADIMKMGVRDAWKAGCFNELKAHLTVHDELVFSIPRTRAGCEAAEELAYHMVSCVAPLLIDKDGIPTVPLSVDKEAGADWWNVDSSSYDEWRKEII